MKRRLAAILIIIGIVLPALASSPSVLRTIAERGDAVQVGSLEEYQALASKVLKGKGYDERSTVYYEKLSGRMLELEASDLPMLRGVSTRDICILAYTSGEWRILAFTVYTRVVSGEGFRLYIIPDNITGDARILVKLPEHPPEFVNPMVDTPPMARGARLWGWVNLTADGFIYPILIAAGSEQVRTMCGHIPRLYDKDPVGRPGLLEKAALPHPLKLLKQQGYAFTPSLLEEILRLPAEARVEPSFGWPNPPLPDGGGGTPPGEETVTVVWSQSPMYPASQGGAWQWVAYTVRVEADSCSGRFEIPFYLYPETSEGPDPEDVRIKKVVLYIYGEPDPEYPGDPTPTLDYWVNLWYNDDEYRTDWGTLIGTVFGDGTSYPDYDVLTFTPPSSSPYWMNTNRLKIVFRPDECNPPTGWTVMFKVLVHVELVDPDVYNVERMAYSLEYRPLYTYHMPGEDYFTEIIINPGEVNNDNETLFFFQPPTDTAFLLEESDFPITAEIPILVELPEWFPGGTLTLHLSLFGSNTIELSSNYSPTPTRVTSLITVEIESLEDLIAFLSENLYIGRSSLQLDSPPSTFQVLRIGVNTDEAFQDEGAMIFQVLPILEVEDDSATYGGGAIDGLVLTPLLDYSGLKTNVYVERLRLAYNTYKMTGNYYRYGVFQASFSVKSYNGFVGIQVQPMEFEYYGNTTILGHGQIEGFEVLVSASTATPCPAISPDDIIVYALAEGGGFLDEFQEYSNIASLALSAAEFIAQGLKLVSYVVPGALLIIELKSVVNVEKLATCNPNQDRATVSVLVRALNYGWAPEGFKNKVDIKLPDLLQYSASIPCNTVNVERIIVYNDDGALIVWAEPLRNARACGEWWW